MHGSSVHWKQVDRHDRKVLQDTIGIHKSQDDFLAYFELSVAQNININEPINWILDRLTRPKMSQTPEYMSQNEILES